MTKTTPLDEFNRRLERAGTGEMLAKELGVSKQLVYHIIKGRRAISLDVAERLGFELAWRKKA